MADTLVSDLLRFHHAITRGMNVSFKRARAFARDGFPDAGTRRGFLDYVHCTVVLTVAHHDTEDDIVFPEFRKRLPGAPYDELDDQHEKLLPLLEAVGESVKAGVDGAPERQWLPALADQVERLGMMWRAHIDLEERHFTEESVARVFSPAEQDELGRRASDHGQKRAQPPSLLVPFVLFNLEDAERAALAARLPPPVMQHLVPVEWKDAWAPMKPFLLA